MKRILYPLLATTVALIILLPSGIFAAQSPGSLCPEHVNRTCFLRDGDFYCSWPEDVAQNRLTRAGRAGQLEWVRVNTARLQAHKCAPLEHPGGE